MLKLPENSVDVVEYELEHVWNARRFRVLEDGDTDIFIGAEVDFNEVGVIFTSDGSAYSFMSKEDNDVFAYQREANNILVKFGDLNKDSYNEKGEIKVDYSDIESVASEMGYEIIIVVDCGETDEEAFDNFGDLLEDDDLIEIEQRAQDIKEIFGDEDDDW